MNKEIASLLNTRALLGHKIGKIYKIKPSVAPFLLGKRKVLPFIAPQLITQHIEQSLNVIAAILKKNGQILVVNTNPEISNLILYFALRLQDSSRSFYFCNEKWAGGLLTNWQQISKSIAIYLSFSERFGRFLLRNNIHFPRYRKMRKVFQGFSPSFAYAKKNQLSSYSASLAPQVKQPKVDKRLPLKKPDLLIIINPNENMNALFEAKKMGIPVIAFANTNIDLSLITYPIPTNNDSPFFAHYYLSLVEKVVNITKF